jgi:hypothetical protein
MLVARRARIVGSSMIIHTSGSLTTVVRLRASGLAAATLSCHGGRVNEADRERLAAAGAPPNALRAARAGGASVHPALAFRLGTPSKTALSPARATLLPLWECGTVVTGLRDDGMFVQLSLELPNEPFWATPSFDEVVERLLVTLWEDDVEDADLREVARLFQFRPIEPLLRRLEGAAGAGDRPWRPISGSASHGRQAMPMKAFPARDSPSAHERPRERRGRQPFSASTMIGLPATISWMSR